jgi:hypothetical protein
MSAYVKITDADARTRCTTLWEPGVRVECARPELPLEPCSAGAIHCYAGDTMEEALALAAMMDPGHGEYGVGARVFAFTPEGEVRDGGDKAICRAGSIGEELALPTPTTEERVEFGIRATLLIPQSAGYVAWAEAWLSGGDRSAEAAAQAARAAWAAWARAAAQAAAWAAAEAARAARAEWAAEWAAARAAAWAAEARADHTLPLASLALAVLEGRGQQWQQAIEEAHR